LKDRGEIMLKKTGVPKLETIKDKFPSEARRKKGPYAVFECYQRIPCNPCSTSCKFNAVDEINDDINNIPVINYENCTGCGLCVSACPGLACFVIDETYSDEKFTIKIPYELLPLPKKGDMVYALDREGNKVDKVEVVGVQANKSLDNTNVITIALSKKHIYSVRSIKVGEISE